MDHTFGGSRVQLCALAALGFGVMGCGNGGQTATGPGGGTASSASFNPMAVSQSLGGVATNLNGDPDVLFSLGLVGPALTAAGAGLPAIMPPDLVRPRSLESVSGRMARSLVLGSGSAAPLFPSSLLGKTFVWMPGLGQYGVDSTLVGAPANGVRFIVYAVDPITSKPVVPLVEVGFLDLTDQSSPASTRLGVHAETGGVVRVDYFIDASFATSGTDVTITLVGTGFVSDGQQQLDFDLNQTVTVTQGLSTIAIDVSDDVGIGAQAITVSLGLSGTFDMAGASQSQDPTPIAVDVTLRITSGGEQIDVVATLTDSTVSGTVSFNGTPVVGIGGTIDNPTFANSDGSALTQEDGQGLKDIFDTIDGVFSFSEDIFKPFDDGF